MAAGHRKYIGAQETWVRWKWSVCSQSSSHILRLIKRQQNVRVVSAPLHKRSGAFATDTSHMSVRFYCECKCLGFTLSLRRPSVVYVFFPLKPLLSALWLLLNRNLHFPNNFKALKTFYHQQLNSQITSCTPCPWTYRRLVSRRTYPHTVSQRARSIWFQFEHLLESNQITSSEKLEKLKNWWQTALLMGNSQDVWFHISKSGCENNAPCYCDP